MSFEKLAFEPLPSTDNEHVFRLLGPVTLNNIFVLQELVGQPSVTTVLDLTGVPYMDSAGLGILVKSHVSHQQNGQRLILVGANHRVLDLFKITKVDTVLELALDMETAHRALGKPERDIA
jgi:anti-sigma B factor antagonist